MSLTGERRPAKNDAEELTGFVEPFEALLERRDRIVYSVPWHDVFGGSLAFIHPRSLAEGAGSARGPLPTTEECEELVHALVAASLHGQWIAPRVGARMSRP